MVPPRYKTKRTSHAKPRLMKQTAKITVPTNWMMAVPGKKRVVPVPTNWTMVVPGKKRVVAAVMDPPQALRPHRHHQLWYVTVRITSAYVGKRFSRPAIALSAFPFFHTGDVIFKKYT